MSQTPATCHTGQMMAFIWSTIIFAIVLDVYSSTCVKLVPLMLTMYKIICLFICIGKIKNCAKTILEILNINLTEGEPAPH